MIGWALYAAWCAFCWRLRGGMISQITLQRFGYALSTGETRVACALLMALPLAICNPWMLSVAPAAFAAMTLGYFDKSMGLEEPGRDHAFLALWGVAVAAIMLVPIAILHRSPLMLAFSAPGLLVAAAYDINKRFGGRWTERAEWMTGAIFGGILWAAAS